jgi:cytidylate kinase
MIIAVDGPAASGKGTIAKALAAHFKLPHLDTGLLYRAVGVSVLRAGGDPAQAIQALAGCAFDDALLADPELKSEAASAAASILSAHSDVRAMLLERQRAFARQPGGAVLDGRDIGTVIAPEAEAKLFVTASPEVRAKRRHLELDGRGISPGYEQVLADIRKRDERDSNRAAAPRVKAADAVLLDTSEMDAASAIEEAIAIVERKRA